jgi:hypothetical protein
MATINATLGSNLLTSNSDQWPNYHGYKPLDRTRREIRLLRISCENEGAVLSCELMHRSLEDEPQYNALSYYWGAAGNLATMLVDGVEVTIRETLHCFLQRLGSRFGPILIWLDAICINQSDIFERNWQVSLMQEIYEYAEKVYAWPGEGDADCLFAMRYVRLQSHGTTDLPMVHPKLLTQYFEQLFLQPYWSRIWIIQEAVLAKQFWLLCGTEMILWDDLMVTFDRLLANRTELPFPHSAPRKVDFWDETEPDEETESFSRFIRFKRAKDSLLNEKYSLLELAKLFRQHNCTDPRDKLYGLRGIASDGKYLRVDYDQSVPHVLLEALGLNIPTIEQFTSRAFSIPYGKLDNAMMLCSSIPMSKVDIMAMLQDTKGHSLLEWLYYHGEVLSCELACWTTELSGYGRQPYWEILVGTNSENGKWYYSTSQDVQLGDRIYRLSTPGEGEEESDEAPRPFAVAFRNVNAHAKAIDRLMTVFQMENLKSYKKSTVDMLLREYNGLRNACIGRIELCSTNMPVLRSLQPEPGIILAHISHATMLALTAWFKCKRIPEYINHFNQNDATGTRLCRCPDNARIVIKTDPWSQTTTFSAPWSSTNVFEIEKHGEAERETGFPRE